MTTLISKTTPIFCHKWQRVRVSSRHLIGRASISIIIIRSIIVITISSILILRIKSHGRRWWRSSLRSKLPMVACRLVMRLTWTFTWYNFVESVHALKLRHDVSQRHITRRRRGSGCGSSRMRGSRMGGRCRILLSRHKLCLTTFYGSGIYGTHESERVICGRRDGKVVKNPRDSRRKDELITGRRILKNIYQRQNKVGGEVYGKMLKNG